jgi:LysM repeat protein
LLYTLPLLASALLVGSAQARPPARTTHRGVEAAPRKAHASRRHGANVGRSVERGKARSDGACPIEHPEAQRATVHSHRILRGESLGGIAARYGSSARVVAAANGLDPKAPIKAGQVLVIPLHLRPGGGDDWLRYARSPKHPGSLQLYTYTSRFEGRVMANGRVLPPARHANSPMLGEQGKNRPISESVLPLLVLVSDTFGGRPVRVVSGFRQRSFYSDSRHRRSEAVDFSIPGVPNAVLRQYLLLLEDVGVGYYPNSSFVHLDVRSCPIQWVDYAGPGEAPRRSPRSAPRRRQVAKAARKRVAKAKDVSEHGADAEHADAEHADAEHADAEHADAEHAEVDDAEVQDADVEPAGVERAEVADESPPVAGPSRLQSAARTQD